MTHGGIGIGLGKEFVEVADDESRAAVEELECQLWKGEKREKKEERRMSTVCD